ncbi:MAG: phosphatidylserine decarboxylase [Candidatus Thermoplasmatota archaeon]|nr:phosphatidylserine decarboxylase [Candidatus Thermoplasmatota archaeon]
MIAKGVGKPLLLSCIPLLVLFLLYLFAGLPIFLFFIFAIPPIFTLYFFRDPGRDVGEGIVSPADGKVQVLDEEENTIKIFMNIWDVHVNRMPLGGEVIEKEHHEGKHFPAFGEKAGENERQFYQIDTEKGNLKIWQISGMFARRIVPYIKKGEKVEKGEKIGMIRFGSKVKLKFSRDVDFHIEEGKRVKAGKTTLGVLHE